MLENISYLERRTPAEEQRLLPETLRPFHCGHPWFAHTVLIDDPHGYLAMGANERLFEALSEIESLEIDAFQLDLPSTPVQRFGKSIFKILGIRI